MKTRMKKALPLIAVLALVTLAAVSCGGSPVVGSWAYNALGVEIVLRFNSDGTFTMSSMGVEAVSGTYSVNGNQIVLFSDQSLIGVGLGSGASTFSVSGNTLVLGSMALTRK